MSLLLFSTRKIQLKREINAMNYELQQIILQKQDAQKTVADKQQYMTDMKNMTSVFASGITNQAIGEALSQAGISAEDYQNQNLSQDQMNLAREAVTRGSQAGAQMSAAFSAITNTIIDAANKQELTRLQAISQSLELKQNAIQSQLSSLDTEYKSVESAEKEAAQSSAPRFGLA